jgi:hypothetical protein
MITHTLSKGNEQSLRGAHGRCDIICYTVKKDLKKADRVEKMFHVEHFTGTGKTARW